MFEDIRVNTSIQNNPFLSEDEFTRYQEIINRDLQHTKARRRQYGRAQSEYLKIYRSISQKTIKQFETESRENLNDLSRELINNPKLSIIGRYIQICLERTTELGSEARDLFLNLSKQPPLHDKLLIPKTHARYYPANPDEGQAPYMELYLSDEFYNNQFTIIKELGKIDPRITTKYEKLALTLAHEMTHAIDQRDRGFCENEIISAITTGRSFLETLDETTNKRQLLKIFSIITGYFEGKNLNIDESPIDDLLIDRIFAESITYLITEFFQNCLSTNNDLAQAHQLLKETIAERLSTIDIPPHYADLSLNLVREIYEVYYNIDERFSEVLFTPEIFEELKQELLNNVQTSLEAETAAETEQPTTGPSLQSEAAREIGQELRASGARIAPEVAAVQAPITIQQDNEKDCCRIL